MFSASITIPEGEGWLSLLRRFSDASASTILNELRYPLGTISARNYRFDTFGQLNKWTAAQP